MKNKQNRKSVPDVYGAEDAYVAEFVNIACDMVDIDGIDEDVPKGFILRSLIRNGRVAYLARDSKAGGWYNAVKSGEPNRYGYYPTLFLTTANGRDGFYANTADGVREIRANATATPPLLIYRKYAKQLALCDRAINANVRAAIISRIIPVMDSTKKEDLEIALHDMEEGLPLIVDGKDVLESMSASSDVSTEFLADRLVGVRSAIWSDACVHLGTVSGNQYKKERVQSAEVDASVAETIDAVYIMINTFNEDCKRYGLPFRMRYTGYADRFDNEDTQKEGGNEE